MQNNKSCDSKYETFGKERPVLNMDVIACVMDQLFVLDRPTFLAASRVCKAWRQTARPILYHVTTLDRQSRFERLRDLLVQNNELASNVHTLIIDASKHAGRKKATDDLQGWIPQAIWFLAPRLRSAESLHFKRVQWNTLVYGLDQSFLESLGRFENVRNVHFNGCDFASFRDFEVILKSFSSKATRLSLTGVQWAGEEVSSGPYYLHFQTLRVFSGCDLYKINSWLARIRAGTADSPLKNLELNGVHSFDLVPFGQIIHRMGPNLQSFKFGILLRVNDFGRAPRQNLKKYISLQTNSYLSDLTIKVGDLIPEHMHWLHSFLHLIVEGTLNTLTFNVYFGACNQMDEDIWGHIAWLISNSPRFASVREVKFVHYGSLDIVSVRRGLKIRFAQLDHQGRLFIDNRRDVSVFGEDDKSILRWRRFGSSGEYIAYLRDREPTTAVTRFLQSIGPGRWY